MFWTVCRVLLLFVAAIILAAPGDSLATSQKPKLIRDTGVAEGKEDPEEVRAKIYNPMEAEKSVSIGDFYFKKKNYVAAIQRYREALEYQPNRIEAFEALARAYEKKGDIAEAIAVCEGFIEEYPSSPKVDDFRSRASKLKKKKK